MGQNSSADWVSILSLVILSPEKGFFPIAIQGHQSWGLRVAAPRILGGGGGGGGGGPRGSGGWGFGGWGGGGGGRVAGGRWSRGRVVKYYYILSCTRSMFESGYF